MSAVNKNKDLRYDGKNHWVIYDDKNSRSRCKLPTCKFFSHLYCQKCDTHLCLTSKRNCFYKYHCRPTVLQQRKKIYHGQKQDKKSVMVGKIKSGQGSIDLNVSAEQSGPKFLRSRKQVKNTIVARKGESEPCLIDTKASAERFGPNLRRGRK